MAENLEDSLQRMNQLQIAFLAKLGDKIKELSRLILQIDISADISSTPVNIKVLQNINQLAHNLAGSSGTFKHMTVYHKAKAIENLSSELLHKPLDQVMPNWHKMLLELVVGLRGDVQLSGRPSVVENFSFKTDLPVSVSQTAEDGQQCLYPVIVVDDDELLVSLIKEQAKYFDYKIIPLLTTANLEEAIDQYHPEAIVVDVVFPDAKHSGVEIINQLKALKKINCPVIFMSNRCDAAVRLDALRAGSDAFISKPLDILELIRILDRLTQKLAKVKSRLLIVDDDSLTASFYQNALTAHNFLCETVINPIETINKALMFNPDAILMDINMPGCDGFELAQVIRQDNNFCHIPILFLTGRSNDEREIYAMKSGGDDFLDKNADLSTIVAIVKGHVQRYRELNSVLTRLKKDEVLFRSITSSSSDAIITVDSKTRILFWNEGAENIFGYSAIETIGQHLHLIIPSEQRAYFNKLITGKASFPNKCTFEISAVKKDKTIIDIELTYTKLLVGNEKFYTTIIRDITHKKRLEQELSNKEASLNAIITQSGEAIITFSDEYIIEMANPKAIELFGYPHDELIGEHILCLIPFSDAKQFQEYVNFVRTADLHQNIPAKELNGLYKNGDIFDLEINISLMKVAGKQKFIAILHDVSERKRFINEILSAKVGAEVASKAKSQFLANISHELRTPMNAILGFAQLMEMENLTEEQHEYTQDILTASQHLLDLINEILELSRIETGSLDLHIEKFDLVGFVNDIIKQQQPLIINANLSINSLSNENTVLVASDKSKLKQIINHLLSNAIKYNKPNGSIIVSLIVTEQKIRLVITDTGRGIAAHLLDNLFEPFNRLGAEIYAIGGTGIGLALSKKLIEMLNGSIGANSKAGEGSSFWLELDRAD